MNPDAPQEPASEKFSDRHRLFVRVDHDICAGFGECVSTAPEVFALNEEGLAVVMDPDVVDRTLLEAAADVCPVSAILLLDEDRAQLAP